MRPLTAKEWLEWGLGVIAMAMVTRIVLPGNNSAAIVESIGKASSGVIKAAVGERAIRERNFPRAIECLADMDDDDLTYLFATLADDDLNWIEQQLSDLDIV